MKWLIFIVGVVLFVIHIIFGIEGGKDPEIKHHISTVLYGVTSLISLLIFIAVLHIEELLEEKK